MRNLKLRKLPILDLGNSPPRKMLLILGPLRAVSPSIRGFLGRLIREMEYGFAVKYVIDLFTQGAISRDEMLARIDELERKFNKS